MITPNFSRTQSNFLNIATSLLLRPRCFSNIRGFFIALPFSKIKLKALFPRSRIFLERLAFFFRAHFSFLVAFSNFSIALTFYQDQGGNHTHSQLHLQNQEKHSHFLSSRSIKNHSTPAFKNSDNHLPPPLYNNSLTNCVTF